MLEHMLSGFMHMSDPMLWLIIILSVGGGIIIGALPGFSAPMGIALFIPFTFQMTPIAGLTALAGIYTGSVYGGAISAILLNIPGAPANIATLFDGYPMAQKGEGRRALLASAIASANGGFISGACLLIFAPLLAIIALKFGAAEKFWVAIFGLVIIANLGTSKDLLKGLMSAVFGIWLGTVGIAPVTGVPRFTFGIMDLWSGIGLIPALVGFFAFSQVLAYFENVMTSGKKSIIQVPTKKGDIINLIKEFWRDHKGLTMFSGILGVLLGIMPGAGGQIGGIVGYDYAKRLSKDPSRFGKGVLEGVIAPETANNATVGGALIPLLTLGIPGSAATAVLLGGLLIHGLWPGPLLFTEHAEITYTFMVAFLFTQIALAFVAIFILKFASNLLKVTEFYLGPAVITLCVFGSFAVGGNFFDIYVMLILGIVGYLFTKFNISLAPAILGLILGPIAEQNFLIATRIGLAEGSIVLHFFTRPISIVIILLIIAVILSTVQIERKRIKREKQMKLISEEDGGSNTLDSEIVKKQPLKGLLTPDGIMGLILLVITIGVWFLYLIPLAWEASIFLHVIFGLLGVVSVIQILISVFGHSDPILWIPYKIIGEISLVSFIAVYLAEPVGFYTVNFFLMFYIGIRMVMFSGESVRKYIIKLLIFSVGGIFFLYVSFGVFLVLPTPRGILF